MEFADKNTGAAAATSSSRILSPNPGIFYTSNNKMEKDPFGAKEMLLFVPIHRWWLML